MRVSEKNPWGTPRESKGNRISCDDRLSSILIPLALSPAWFPPALPLQLSPFDFSPLVSRVYRVCARHFPSNHSKQLPPMSRGLSVECHRGVEHASSHSKLGHNACFDFASSLLLSLRFFLSVRCLLVTFASREKGKRRPPAHEPRERLYYLSRKSGSSRTIRWESWSDSMIQQGLFSTPCSWGVEGDVCRIVFVKARQGG